MPKARNSALKIGGVTIRAGETKDIGLNLSETYTGDTIRMPVRVIRSKKAGPRVFVTAAIHGDEINGTGIIHDFLFGQSCELKCGTLILVPVVNVLGFENNQRYLPDRRDLNRSFPGSQNGSMAGRIAYKLMNEIAKKCDYGIDLHSAAFQRTNYPNVRADLSSPNIRKLASAFGCALVIDGKGPLGSFRRESARAGTPTIILEAGEPWKIEPSVLQIGVQGIRNVLVHLGMQDGQPSPPPFQATIRKTLWLRATVGGILKFHISPGAFVREGEAIATNYSILGEEQNIITSPTHGIAIGMATMPAVKPGEPVCHIAKLSESQIKRYERSLNKDKSDPYKQAQSDLATNLDVVEVNES
ncbi:succinylglutamate desuccinylase/aspartoacylase family protein [Pelagicoccus sp. NFK12]|uniref:Succinylglutamate desuccinylase/aspartoacylase family protein n=1 Tax=Pelagicoccus enzymogenes TaxID=2773457 RepID=A0A927IJY0_9BACT|nr:succinylglutamate desuccinylase/aspartoacylase family protein [Pelagicoccus enzymogenes]MBD5782263.1 succinylglutamate desuccinylase/aspartoacylase family protein [Pelagicoccus enzymogenes]MDQ8197841.1 succinylglutamate desuccinylase/aspartoacylase family protein [Pelagicoccus enzymogenes]